VITVVRWVLPLNLFCGLVIVLHASSQPVTVVEQKIADDVTAVEARVHRLEDLHLEGRLAVLDELKDRSWRIELLVIGLFITTGGHWLMQAWLHRGRPRMRVDDEREG